VCNGLFGSPVGPERFAAVPAPGVKTFPLHTTSTSRSLIHDRPSGTLLLAFRPTRDATKPLDGAT